MFECLLRNNNVYSRSQIAFGAQSAGVKRKLEEPDSQVSIISQEVRGHTSYLTFASLNK